MTTNATPSNHRVNAEEVVLQKEQAECQCDARDVKDGAACCDEATCCASSEKADCCGPNVACCCK